MYKRTVRDAAVIHPVPVWCLFSLKLVCCLLDTIRRRIPVSTTCGARTAQNPPPRRSTTSQPAVALAPLPLWRCPLPPLTKHRPLRADASRPPRETRPQGASLPAPAVRSFPMATACRLAAPLGLAPLPRGRASAGVVAVAPCGEIEHLFLPLSRRIPLFYASPPPSAYASC